MSRCARPVQLVLRSTALLLALICLWLSSGATLRHTDDLSAFRAFHTRRTTDQHSARLPVTADVCAAHRWMDAWQTLPAASPPVVWAPVTLAVIACPLSPALHLRCFDYTRLRGPRPSPKTLTFLAFTTYSLVWLKDRLPSARFRANGRGG